MELTYLLRNTRIETIEQVEEKKYKIMLIRTIHGRERSLQKKKLTDFDVLYDSSILELENYDSQLEVLAMEEVRRRKKGITRHWNG